MNKRLALLLLLLCGLVHADDSAEKERLKKQREAIEAEHAQREQACHQQFVVNSCLEKARIDRQQALQTVRTQELAIEDAERRERAQAQAERLEKKAQAAQERNSKKAVEPKPAKAPSAAPRAKEPKPSAPNASAADRSANEKQEREAFDARQREIKAHREAVEKRNAERAKRKPPPQPLSVPASAALE
jgi:colicin import membrane protein